MATEPSQKDAPDARELWQVQGSIDVDHVSFSYDGDLAVLHNVDLHVQPGETVAIVGPSGVANPPCAFDSPFYDVSSGSIRIDGVDVRQVKQRSIHLRTSALSSRTCSSLPIRFLRISAMASLTPQRKGVQAARKAEIYDDITRYARWV